MGLKVVLSDRWQSGKEELRNPGDSALQPLSLIGSVMVISLRGNSLSD